MDPSVQITFRGFQHTPDLDASIRQQADELLALSGRRMTAARVVVELQHPHGQPAACFHVHIELELPGGTISVNREAQDADLERSHEDPFVAARDSFAVARRQLHDWEQRQHAH